MRKLMVVLHIFILAGSWIFAATPLFEEKIKIKLETKQDYAYFTHCDILPDGFVVLFEESSSGNTLTLVKFDKNGKHLCDYKARGVGPGELSNVGNIFVGQRSILVCEFLSPVIHEFNLDLKFLKDHRIKLGGKVFYCDDKTIAVWAKHYHEDLVDLVTLYNRNDLSLKGYTFTINKKMVPAFVHYDGSFRSIDQKGFAGLCPSEYQVKLFNPDFSYNRDLIKNVPSYIKKYFPWNKSTSQVNVNEAEKWLRSWTNMYSLFYIDNLFVISYSEGNNNYFLDIVNSNGDVLFSKFKIKFFPICAKDNLLWFFSVDEKDDITTYTLIGNQINMDALKHQ